MTSIQEPKKTAPEPECGQFQRRLAWNDNNNKINSNVKLQADFQISERVSRV